MFKEILRFLAFLHQTAKANCFPEPLRREDAREWFQRLSKITKPITFYFFVSGGYEHSCLNIPTHVLLRTYARI